MRRESNGQRRPGRPPLPPWQRRGIRIRLDLTSREYDLLLRRAEHASVAPHHLARELALYGRLEVAPVPRANYAVVGQLGRIGGLLNQALRQVNSGRLAPDLRVLVETTLGVLSALRHDLVTGAES